jgi:protoporphyrinogen oxidase
MRWIKLFENFNNLENIVLIGGGISSLYAAYLIKKKLPGVKYTIIEKDSKCGGRVKMSKINDVYVPTGAQFTRVDKDHILNKLLKDLDIKLDINTLDIDYTFKKHDISEMTKKLNSNINKFDRSKVTFKEFASEVLDKDYNKFIDMMGYSDYEKADIEDTLYNYGLDDNIPGYKYANIPYNIVIERLIEEVGSENIILNTEVNSIKKENQSFLINSKIKCDGIIIGVTINQLRKLLDNSIYKQIESQNFLKTFAVSNNLNVDKYTIVDSPLRKILPIKDNVYTITYNDNKDAKKLKDKDKDYFEDLLSKEFNRDIKLSNLKKFFWEEGTHYYKPLPTKYKNRKEFIKEAQHPKDNIWVIGEVVAEKQGWVEGALSSVEKISLFSKIKR